MHHRALLAACVLAFVNALDLKETILSNLEVETEAVPESVCFVTPPVVGNGKFFEGLGVAQSTLGTSDQGDCKVQQYPACFAKNGIPGIPDPKGNDTCRLAVAYEIISTTPAPTPDSQRPPPPICPPILEPGKEGCRCQEDLAANRNITLTFSLTQKSCCGTCRCYGDPHCVDFAGEMDNWVVCRGGRNPKNCDLNKTLCAETTWTQNGLVGTGTCYVNDKNLCAPNALNGQMPSMLMYAKTYGNKLPFNVTLTLGAYGSITAVTIIMDKTKFVYNKANGKTLKKGDADYVNILATAKVDITVLFGVGGSVVGNYDVTINDLALDASGSVTNGNGFCITGNITENPADDPQCEPDNYKFHEMICRVPNYGTKFGIAASDCSGGTKGALVANAFSKWCRFAFGKACSSTVWYREMCKWLEIRNPGYKTCISDMQDFPFVVLSQPFNNILGRPASSTGILTPCPPDFDLSSLAIPTDDAYLYVQKLNENKGVWENKWYITALQLRCFGPISVGLIGGQQEPLKFEDVGQAGSSYRVLQCQSINGPCAEHFKELKVDVTYNGGLDAQVTVPLGALWTEGVIQCTKCQQCQDTKCCEWYGEEAHNTCMTSFYGKNWATNPLYTKCPCYPTW